MRPLAALTVAGAVWLALTSFTAPAHAHELLIKTSGQLNVTATSTDQTCVFEPPTPRADGSKPSCAESCAAKGACLPAGTPGANESNTCSGLVQSSTLCFCCYKSGQSANSPAEPK